MNRILGMIIILISGCILYGCSVSPAQDIRGNWTYELLTLDGEFYDHGTIRFNGQTQKGEYNQINIYNIEYTGAYTVDGNQIELSGDENWAGTVENIDNIQGTWEIEDGTHGTFHATRE